MAVDVLANRTYRINGGEHVSEWALKRQFGLIEGDFIVQERLEAAIELAELATNGLPPVLRLTVIRELGRQSLSTFGSYFH